VNVIGHEVEKIGANVKSQTPVGPAQTVSPLSSHVVGIVVGHCVMNGSQIVVAPATSAQTVTVSGQIVS
jgi:hypothetical protein